MKAKSKRVFFVDDEPSVRKAMEVAVQRYYDIMTFASAADCLDELRFSGCDLLITDVQMPEMNGIELINEVKKINPPLPILVVTGYADIPMAVKAIKAGAFEFIEKPFDREQLLVLIDSILNEIAMIDPVIGKMLTKTETEILSFILHGQSNKNIAHVTNRSVRTIEDHKNKIMRKLDVHNTVELIKTALNMKVNA